MLSKSTLLHLRLPFSYFLLPAYLFALGISPNLSEKNLLWSFLIIHFLLYPASNGYNSYFDKDQKSIGGLKNPPPVTRDLYYISILLDVLAIVLSLIYINTSFAILVFVYGLVSKAYSHPSIRLKKYPIAGWLTVVLFQGVFTFFMCYEGINALPFENLLHSKVVESAALTSLLLCGSYPLTQVYQHEEDNLHGDRTMSILLGVKGTFYFAMLFFSVAVACFVWYFRQFFSIQWAVIFLVFLIPVLIYFSVWFVLVLKDTRKASYSMAMWQNFVAATCLSGFFVYFFLETSHILQL
jgi:4-hydroxybenzoate polyprenyltransferase